MAKRAPAHAGFDLPFDDEFSDPEFDDNDFDTPDVPTPPAVVTANGTRTFPHPVTGKQITCPRASQYAKAAADDFTLVEWKIAQTVLGMGLREDLVALAASQPTPIEPVEARPTGWWSPYAEIGHMAMDAAKYKSGAHKGTAIHQWDEAIGRGRIAVDDVPERWRSHLAHLQRIRDEAGLPVHPDYLETGVYTDKLHNGVVGRMDYLSVQDGGWLMVGDDKTGKQAPKGLDEIAVQLAIYANSEWHIDFTTGEATPAPPNVRKDVAFVAWCPIDRPEASEIIPVDIAWGWQAAKVISWLRSYRNRSQRVNNGLRLPSSSITPPAPYRPDGFGPEVLSAVKYGPKLPATPDLLKALQDSVDPCPVLS